MKIDRDLSTEKEIVLTSTTRRPQDRPLAKKHAFRDRSKAVRFVRTVDRDGPDNPGLDFIAFSTARRRKRDEDEDGEAGEGEADYDYWGFRDGKSEKPTDPDAEYESETGMGFANSEVTARNSELVRRTKSCPGELQAWIDFIDHQEAMMNMERPPTEGRSVNKQQLADVRISICEKALRHSTSDEIFQTELYCRMMTEAVNVWSAEHLTKKWIGILTKFPSNTKLWIKYLDHVQSNFTSFRYETCKATFQKCLHTLSSLSIDTNMCLYIFCRLTSMIHQAGYQELALAIWQALLEYHTLAPVDALQSVDERLQRFEEFWESEVARVGEANAKGWRHSDVEDGPVLDTNSIPLNEPDPTDTLINDLYKREVDCMSKLRYPGRTTDEVGEDDPFHTILFSDVEPFLKFLPQVDETNVVLSAFLDFCGLPPLLVSGSCGEKHVFDPFLRMEFYDVPRGRPDGLKQLIDHYGNCPIKNFRTNTQLLFDQSFPEKSTIVDTEFVIKVLQLLISTAPETESIGEYLLALESKTSSADAFRTAKRLLKAHPTSLRLYNAYGLVESRRNNSTKADQVFSAALSMQEGRMQYSISHSLELFYNWVWEALRQGSRKEALWRLVSPTGKVTKTSTDFEEAPNPTALLRAQRTLDNACEQALLSADFPKAMLATSLLALLAYFSGDEKPEPALVAFEQLSKWFASHNMSQSPIVEPHAQYIAQFIAYHAGHAPVVKPSLLRDTLEPLIAAFPNNTILLSVYAANEARFAIDDRVRSIMHQSSNDQPRTIVSWTFAIYYEILRGEVAGSTSHSIRALYKQAEDDIGAHCPALWRQHVLFEIAEARKESAKRPRKRPRKDGKRSREEIRVEETNQRVKDTFFRGMTCLPWCKTYMMMAFTHLGEEFLSKEDLTKVYDVMAEKELRLYVELEEGRA